MNQESPLVQLVSRASTLQQPPLAVSMNPNYLAPAAPTAASITKAKEQMIQKAQAAQQDLAAKLKNHNVEIPPFEFLELIGKGAFGRVYKA